MENKNSFTESAHTALIESVIEEVYRRLEYNSKKKSFLLLGNIDKKYSHMLCSYFDISDKFEEQKTFDGILITKLSIAMMAHLALGIPTSPTEDLLIQFLLMGKPVYVLENGLIFHNFKESASKNLYSLYLTYEKKLAQYGIKYISDFDSLIEAETNTKISSIDTPPLLPVDSSSNDIQNFSHKENDVNLTKKNLITEKDLIDLHIPSGTNINLKKKCIITPMAYDYLKSHRIKFFRIL